MSAPTTRAVVTATALIVGAGQAAAQESGLSKVAWLAGCWERALSNRRGVEVWEAPRAGVMSGGSFIVTDTSRRETEHLRLWAEGDTLVYEAHPSIQHRTAFRASTGSTEITFANPEHDFPQRIVYRKVGADSLIARIEGDRAGRRQPVSYPFRRVACDPALTTQVNLRGTLYAMYDTLSRRTAESPGARLEWLLDHAASGFAFVVWSVPGSSVISFDSAALRRSATQRAEAFRAMKPLDSKATVSVERILSRGDSLDVLASVVSGYRVVDDSGRFGPRGQTVQRGSATRMLDRWVRVVGQLKLVRTEILSEEISTNGRVTIRDGRPVPPP